MSNSMIEKADIERLEARLQSGELSPDFHLRQQVISRLAEAHGGFKMASGLLSAIVGFSVLGWLGGVGIALVAAQYLLNWQKQRQQSWEAIETGKYAHLLEPEEQRQYKRIYGEEALEKAIAGDYSHAAVDVKATVVEPALPEQPKLEAAQPEAPAAEAPPETPPATTAPSLPPIDGLKEAPVAAQELVVNLVRSPLSKVIGAVPGSGKTTLQRAMIKAAIEQYPEALVFIAQTKRDLFLGLEDVPGAIAFCSPSQDDGQGILEQAQLVSEIYRLRTRFPSNEARVMFANRPVYFLLCDYSDALRQCSSEVKQNLVKIVQQLLFNGRALNVQVWLDVQVLNLLTALGLEGADSRSAAILLCLGSDRPDVGGDFGVVENALTGSSQSLPDGLKARLKPHLEDYKERSRATRRTLAVTAFMDTGALLLPDWSALEEQRLSPERIARIAANTQQAIDFVNLQKPAPQPLPQPLPQPEVMITASPPASSPQTPPTQGQEVAASTSPEVPQGEVAADLQLYKAVKLMQSLNKSNTWIIENVLGYKGRRYQDGKVVLKSLLDAHEGDSGSGAASSPPSQPTG